MANSDQRYLCGVAYARAVWTPPSNPEERIVWNRWLKGLAIIIASSAGFASFLASGSTSRPLEATVQMERLAAKLEQMKVIHPETAQTIASLILQPSYDCAQVTCNAAVQARNSAARSRLEAMLAKLTGKIQSAGKIPTVSISTGSTREAVQNE